MPVIDSALEGSSVLDEILSSYETEANRIVLPTKLIKLSGEPTYRLLDSYANELRARSPDLILAIGGGSVMDVAKGIAVLLNNPGNAIDYRGMHKVSEQSVPVVAYPTTAGTGSEVTWTASFIDEKDGKKLGINGQNVTPLCGVLEPRLVNQCPRAVALSAGLDTMVHAIEAVTANTATQITRYLGSYAFSLVYEFLPIALENKENLEAWRQVQLGAYLAGVAMMNAGGGPASGISYPLGVHYKVPHGFAGGVLLPGVFAMNVEKGYEGYSQVYDALCDARPFETKSEKSQQFVENFKIFYQKIGGPKNLMQWGCEGSKAINKLTQLTLEQRMENLLLNPVLFNEADVKKLLQMVCVLETEKVGV